MAEQVTRRWRRVATAYHTGGGKRESEVNVYALMSLPLSVAAPKTPAA